MIGISRCWPFVWRDGRPGWLFQHDTPLKAWLRWQCFRNAWGQIVVGLPFLSLVLGRRTA